METRKWLKKKEKALLENNIQNLLDATIELGCIYSREEDWESALHQYTEAKEYAMKLNDRISCAVAHRMIGETYLCMENFKQAVHHHRSYLDISRQQNDVIEEQRALATLGRTYYVQADSMNCDSNQKTKKEVLDLSRQCYLKSLKICTEKLVDKVDGKELALMKSRLYLNLGVTLDALDEDKVALQFMQKSIELCKNINSSEDIIRCYTSLATIYIKRRINLHQALQYINEGLNLMKSVGIKNFPCDLLILKADVLIEMADFNEVKNVLIQAYKMSDKDHDEVERRLRIVAVICKAEETLLKADSCDYVTRKCENEKLADCLVALRQYKKAIDYYLKMLECCVNLGESGSALVPAFTSLAQTYKDNKDYTEAILYFKKELHEHINSENYAEACRTFINIAETMEIRGDPFADIIDKYREAIVYSERSNNLKLKANILQAMKNLQLLNGYVDQADMTGKELRDIEANISDCYDDFASEIEDELEIGKDINLDELCDSIVPNNECNTQSSSSSGRKRTKAYNIVKNEKGETALHKACIKGDLALANQLISQSHPLNIEDVAGWTPLHEACNHGHANIVAALVEAGAKIDNRGGPLCNITPLLDAATNGQLEIIEYLLDKGANPLVKTEKGENALDCLLECRERVVKENGTELDRETLAHFNAICDRLCDVLKKAGYTPRRPLPPEEILKTASSRNIEIEPRRSFKEGNNAKTYEDAANDYQTVINSFRRKKKTGVTKQSLPVLQSCPAFLTEDEVGDDWLDKDVVEKTSRRKREVFAGSSLRIQRKNTSQPSQHSRSNKRPSNILTMDEESNSPQRDDTNFVENIGDSFPTHSTPSPLEADRWGQVQVPTIQDEVNINCPIQEWSANIQSASEQQGFQDRLLSQTASAVQHQPQTASAMQHQSPPATTVKVKAGDMCFLIPIPSNSHTLNIQWLANETKRRYQKKVNKSLNIRLSTTDGALLDEDDPLSIVAGMTEVLATIECLGNDKPFSEQFRNQCSTITYDSQSLYKFGNICKQLEADLDSCQATGKLILSHRGRIPAQILAVIWNVISYQNINEMHLSGMGFTNCELDAILKILPSMGHLRVLDFCCNKISSEGIASFANTIAKNRNLLTLEHLAFSYNRLKNESLAHLVKLTELLNNLRVLLLSHVEITCDGLREIELRLDYLEKLDISFNDLKREGVSKFLAYMDPRVVQELNVSGCGGPEVARECALFFERFSSDNLIALSVSNLNLTDDDLSYLAESLRNAIQLRFVDFTNNPNLSADILQTFSQLLPSVRKIRYFGCQTTDTIQLTKKKTAFSVTSRLHVAEFLEGPYQLRTNEFPSLLH